MSSRLRAASRALRYNIFCLCNVEIIVHFTSCPKRALESLQILSVAVELCPNHSHRPPCTGQQLLQPYALQQAGKTVQWVDYPIEIQPRVKKRRFDITLLELGYHAK